LTCSCDVSGCCETPVSHKCDTHDDGTDFSDIAAARREGVIEGLRLAEKCVPTNWLDPLLTGPDAVLKKGHDNREIEALLRGVQDRVRAEIAKLKGES